MRQNPASMEVFRKDDRMQKTGCTNWKTGLIHKITGQKQAIGRSRWALTLAEQRLAFRVDLDEEVNDPRRRRTGLTTRPMGSLRIIYKDPNLLKPRAKNPRTHTAKQIQQIATSIGEFGFINPILIDGSDRIIAGHGRVLAAKSLGMADVPTVRVDHLTPAQIRAYVIADHKLAENAGWDRTLL